MNKPTKYLLNLPVHTTSSKTVQLLRIILEEQFTRFDFGYQATDRYDRGGWVRMSQDTFIRIKPDGEKLKITSAVNIPLGEEKHEFHSTKDWLYYSLYFPAIPPKSCVLDLIKHENKEENKFNFYDIQIRMSEAIKLL